MQPDMVPAEADNRYKVEERAVRSKSQVEVSAKRYHQES